MEIRPQNDDRLSNTQTRPALGEGNAGRSVQSELRIVRQTQFSNTHLTV